MRKRKTNISYDKDPLKFYFVEFKNEYTYMYLTFKVWISIRNKYIHFFIQKFQKLLNKTSCYIL